VPDQHTVLYQLLKHVPHARFEDLAYNVTRLRSRGERSGRRQTSPNRMPFVYCTRAGTTAP
jgi:hypothetical protein